MLLPMVGVGLSQATFIRCGGGGISDETHPPDFGSAHLTLGTSPPSYNSVGSIFGKSNHHEVCEKMEKEQRPLTDKNLCTPGIEPMPFHSATKYSTN